MLDFTPRLNEKNIVVESTPMVINLPTGNQMQKIIIKNTGQNKVKIKGAYRSKRTLSKNETIQYINVKNGRKWVKC